MKTIEILSKRVPINKKLVKQRYTVTINEKYEKEIKQLLETATIFNPQDLFTKLSKEYDSRLVSVSIVK
jgi:hypothetical protein